MRIRSEMFLPGVPQAEWDGEPDVVFRRGTVNSESSDFVDAGVFWKTAPGLFQISIDDVATYVVRDGTEVIVQPAPKANDHDVATFLLGSVMGGLLYQRGLWPMHASTVVTSQGAVLFAGRSGMGKSTLAAGLQKRGYTLMSDDVSPLEITGSSVSVFPAVPRIKLKPDATSELEVDVTGVRRDHARGKYLTPVERFAEQPCPVRRIVLLDLTADDHCQIRPVSGPEAIGLLARATYRRKFMKGLGLHEHHFPRMTALAGLVPLSVLLRPAELKGLDRTLDSIELLLN